MGVEVSELTQLDDWLVGLVEKLTPAQRRKLMRQWAISLRKSQQQRIQQQQNPDGSPYEAKQPQKRNKKGRISQKMFRKIRTPRYMKATSTTDKIEVGFSSGSSARIAAVHQYGLREKLGKRKPVTYPQRQLLGVTDADIAHLCDQLLEHLQQ